MVRIKLVVVDAGTEKNTQLLISVSGMASGGKCGCHTHTDRHTTTHPKAQSATLFVGGLWAVGERQKNMRLWP